MIETKNAYVSESANVSTGVDLPFLYRHHHVRCGREEEVNAIRAEDESEGRRVRL